MASETSYTVSGTEYSQNGIATPYSTAVGNTGAVTLPHVDGIYQVSYSLGDNAGYRAPTETYIVEVEALAPTIMVTPGYDISLSAWYNSAGNGRWQITLANDIPDVTSGQYQIGYSATKPSVPITSDNFSSLIIIDQGSVGASPVAIPNGYSATTGFYFLLVKASNNAGLAAIPVVSGPYQLDTIKPTMGSHMTASFPGDGTVSVNWSPALDLIAGLSSTPYSLTYTVNGISSSPISVALNPNQLSANQSLALLHGSSVTFILTATNNAAVSNSISVTVTIPPVLSFTAVSGSTNGQFMEVDLDFNITPQQMHDNFTVLNFTRTLSPGSLPSLSTGSTVTLSNLNIDPTKIPLNPDGSLVFDTSSMPLWKTDSRGNIEYVDWIPVSNGAGHKQWNYTLVPTPLTEPVANATQSATLPNNQGSLIFQIEDVNGNLYSPASTAFHVYADGRVQVLIQGTDPDSDHWDYEVDRTMQMGPLSAYKSLSGAALIGYDGAPTGAQGAPVPITLRQGINNLSVFWRKGKTPMLFSTPRLRTWIWSSTPRRELTPSA